ncbi:hypothetical protein AB434_0338 [Heyndrickxia coagulans]|uniref:Uncharacterized protein n=1 Tax=Heyndrickxia coagulans TaxID=1398 RepID=A0AAN0T2S5_HEYCO|nr:hypothetical protein SB48_HM08orf01308 [Heyndrickxia coagulans]AKN52743.1 hypothetical protein AB434_0338 [Heyndrickxia coagulans]
MAAHRPENPVKVPGFAVKIPSNPPGFLRQGKSAFSSMGRKQ